MVQLTAGADPVANRETAGRLVRRAATLGAQLVVLPERWNGVHDRAGTLAAAEDRDGPSLRAAAGWARELGLWLVAGSVGERLPDGRPPANTSVAFDPAGEVVAVYRKVHMFDVEVGGRAYRESDEASPGDALTWALLAGVPVGMSVCYDLRFPEVYRALTLAGARVLAVPSAFTAATGPDHWEVLLRARAIENQAFVLAADQVGRHATGARSHGRSMIIDPWGVVLAQAGDGEGVALADLDLRAQDDVRTRLPALRHRRPDVYGRAPSSTAGISPPAGPAATPAAPVPPEG